MMGRWTSPTRPPDLHGDRSPPSTRSASSTSTTRSRPARPSEARCCAARACTTPTSRSGARPATPAPARASRRRPSRVVRRRRWSWSGCATATSGSRPSSSAPRRRWRSREKCTRSWNSSPRAPTPKEVEAVIDEHLTDLEAVTSTKQASELLGASRATVCIAGVARRIFAGGAAAGAGEQAHRSRTPAHPGGAAQREVLRPRARPGVGPAARRRHLPTCAPSRPCTAAPCRR